MIRQELIHEFLVTLHAFFVIIGMGGVIFAHLYSLKFLETETTRESSVAKFAFFHMYIKAGLWAIIFTGICLLVFYAFYTPTALLNTKIYAKILIVIYLTVISIRIEKHLIPFLTKQIGKHILDDVSINQIERLTLIAGQSLIAWSYLFILGSFRQLNLIAHTVPSFVLYLFYYLLPFGLSMLILYIFIKMASLMIMVLLQQTSKTKKLNIQTIETKNHEEEQH